MKTSEFSWTDFYIEMANQLRSYKDSRKELLQIVRKAHESAGLKYPFLDHGKPLEDVCPFSVMGTFNKGTTEENRIKLIKEYARELNIDKPIPEDFDGIPVLMTMASWFFSYKDESGPDDIENLWKLFEAAIIYSDEPSEKTQERFTFWFDIVRKQKGVKWNITMGLYWIRPETFLNLDGKNRNYLSLQTSNLTEELNSRIKEITNFKKMLTGQEYRRLTELCIEFFEKKDFPFDNFRELSFEAWANSNEVVTDELVDIGEKTTKYWLYAPGEDSRYWNEFYKKKIMGIGWEEMENLQQYKSKGAMKRKMKSLYGEELSYIHSVHATWQFANEIQLGDVIFVKKGVHKIIGKGLVQSDYYFDEKRDEYNNLRKVEWTHVGEWDYPGQAAQKTLTEITSYTDTVEKLKKLFINDGESETNLEEIDITYDSYTASDFLEEVFMNEEQYQTIVDLLLRKKNLILQGAPGVGKTFAAKRVAYSIMGEKDVSRVMLVQFHQSYSYEDFIMGYRPTNTGFELTQGPFYTFCKKAEMDNEREYFFIIDEINRGNLSKIFGELMMLIESDKRTEKIKLLYANELFSIPKNVHIIGMMNTADRSLAIIDYALRRRFAFFDMEPAFESELFKNIIENANLQQYDKLVDQIKSLNEFIGNDEALGNGFRVGHSYLCPKEVVSTEWLLSTVRYEIIPLLNEYWFDEADKVKLWTDKLNGALK